MKRVPRALTPPGGYGEAMSAAATVWAPRWRGRAGRLEVWYTTLTDPRTGTGAWLHSERVAPADGSPAFRHGWVAVFPPGAKPLVSRFGPRALDAGMPPEVAENYDGPQRLAGHCDTAHWTLTARWSAGPLYTFPRWAWRREILPATHLVATPGARFDGTIHIGGREFFFADAPGASSRIYGSGNAHRWAWLHADLDDDTVLEVVAAVSHLAPLRRLAPLTFARLRSRTGELPSLPGLVRAARWRTHLAASSWTAAGPVATGQRLQIAVQLPAASTLTLDYAEPRGHAVRCANTERADAVVVWNRREGRRWEEVRTWRLHGTAHAEIGGSVSDGSDYLP